jgi:hypothetical protein
LADITAFGTIFAAAGCKLNYNSEKVRLEIISGTKFDIVDKAVQDINKYDDTANYLDGAAALVLAETIDGVKNPIVARIRKNILEGLGLMIYGKYIYQVLSLQKNNRAWHNSDKANDCSNFGTVCTHRGITPNPDRKGRRSNRQPNEYHRLDGRDMIAREQLVTPALEKLFQSIPQSNLVSGHQFQSIDLNLKALSKMPLEDKFKAILQIQESM